MQSVASPLYRPRWSKIRTPLSDNAVGSSAWIRAGHRIQHHRPDPGQPKFAREHQSIWTRTGNDDVNHCAQRSSGLAATTEWAKTKLHIRLTARSQVPAKDAEQNWRMDPTAPHHRRQSAKIQTMLVGAAALATFALFDAAWPDIAHTMHDTALPAAASGPSGGFAADNDDEQAQQQAQLQEQLALQQMQQSMQQAEQQNEQAQQQFEQDMQQAQRDEQQANDP